MVISRTVPSMSIEMVPVAAPSPNPGSFQVRGPILIVDDDPDLRELMSDLLASHGYAVETAADGQEALDYLHSSRASPSLIILDLMMPRMDGWEFREHQRADPELARIPVVVFSGVHDLERCTRDIAAVEILPKPIDIDRLHRTLRRHC